MADLRAMPNNYTADWSAGLGADWVDIFGHTPGFSNGKLIYNAANCADGNARPMPKFMIGAGVPFTIEATSKFTGTLHEEAGESLDGYRAVSLYNGEWNYAGVYFMNNGEVDIIDFPPGGTGMVWLKGVTAVKPAGFVASGDTMTVKIEHSHALGETYFSVKKNAGAYELLYTRTDGVNNRAWAEPSSLWLQNYKMEGEGWELEYGPVSITRVSDKTILGGAFDFYGWGGWQATSQAIWGDWPTFDESTPTVYDTFAAWREGGTEGCPTAGGLMGSYFEETDPTQNFYAHAGTATTLSPGIVTTGEFSALRLFGKQNVGTTRVRVTDAAGDLIPDAQITGNSTGFFPDGGSFTPTSVDLSGVTGQTVRLEIVTTVPAPAKDTVVYEFGNTASYNWSTVLYGFIIESSTEVIMAGHIDGTIDAGLNACKSNAIRATVCSAEPASYAGIAAVALGEVTISSADFTGPADDTSGRKLTFGGKAGVAISANGDVTFCAFHDNSAVLYATAPVTSQAVTSGQSWTLPSCKIAIADPA